MGTDGAIRLQGLDVEVNQVVVLGEFQNAHHCVLFG